MKPTTLPIGTLAGFLLWVGLLGAALFWWSSVSRPISPELKQVLRSQPRLLQGFSLVDQYQRPFTDANLRGKWTFLFFGYTYCPDICPTTLGTLKQTLDLLRKTPQDADDLQVAFVSVDPERDHTDVLRNYMAYFDKTFIGLTGQRQQIDNLVAQTGAGYIKEAEQTPGNYLISHSSSLFLINPTGQLVAVFPPPLYPDSIASLYRELRAHY